MKKAARQRGEVVGRLETEATRAEGWCKGLNVRAQRRVNQEAPGDGV